MLRSSWLPAVFCLGLLFASGCATIRKFSPVETHTLEARQLTHQAESAIHRADWELAENKLLRAVERCPEDHRARACLADVMWNQGDRQSAVEQLARSIELSGNTDAAALTRLGEMQLELGNPQAAQQYADDALSHDRQHADAWTLRGYALRGQGRPQSATSAFFRSLSLRGDHLPTRLAAAELLGESGNARRALAVLDGMAPPANECPYRGQVCFLRGKLLRTMDRPGEASLAFHAAQQHGLEHDELLYYLAESQLAAGNAQQAQQTLHTATAPSTGDAVAWAELRNRIDQALPQGARAWR